MSVASTRPSRTAQRDYCLSPARTATAPVAGGARYGRLFPALEPLGDDEQFLHTIGRQGGVCDVDAAHDGDGRGQDAREAAGWPFFGQFIAHDITADRSALAHTADINALRNARTAQLNLECLYGLGPTPEPYLYDADYATLLLGVNDAGRENDLLRNRRGTAIIGDPRNDVHLPISQLHVAMTKLHNTLVARLRSDGIPDDELFDAARRATTWHYQWIVLHDFLPRLCGADLIDDILAHGRRFYRPDDGDAYIPLEFADAAYRYGHSQIRSTYRLNAALAPAPLFPDFLGFRPVPEARRVDWAFLFDLPTEQLSSRSPAAGRAQRAKKMDGRLPASLLRLPDAITGACEDDDDHSLAVRDLRRGHATQLPSGEAVARYMGADVVPADAIGLATCGWRGETPLWYYVLKEAEVLHDGDQLGPVGGRIVAEVLIGIMDLDPLSFRQLQPDWTPTLPSTRDGRFTLGDVLLLADQA